MLNLFVNAIMREEILESEKHMYNLQDFEIFIAHFMQGIQKIREEKNNKKCDFIVAHS